MPRCCTCRVALRDDEPSIVCCDCKFHFHAVECSGMTEEVFNSKKSKKSWKCAMCRPSGARDDGPVAFGKEDAELKSLVLEINRKLSSLLPLTDKVDGIEQSIQMLSNQFDAVQEKLKQQGKEIKDIKARIDRIEREEDIGGLARLQMDVDELEWRSRRLNIEIHGLAESQDEDLLAKVNELADELNMHQLVKEDVLAVHRLPAKPGYTKAVIVRFARQDLRDAWLEKRKALRDSEGKRYITENMTKRSKALLVAVKAWAKSHDYDFAWHSNGKVLVRRRPGDSAVVIKCESDLSNLVT